MISPTTHIPAERTLLGAGAAIISALPQPTTVTTLHTLGTITLDGGPRGSRDEWSGLRERQEGVVEVKSLRPSRPWMTAASHPILVKSDSRTETFGGPQLPVEVSVYPSRGVIGGPRFQIASHEADRALVSVLAGSEAVDALLDILAALRGIGPRDAFALDDRVRILFVERFDDCREVDGKVDAAIRGTQIRSRDRFCAQGHKHLRPLPGDPSFDSFPHSVS